MSKTKNILVLNGSPRKRGNTALLVEAFTEGAQSAGHNVTTFFLESMNINGCKGCMKGGKNPQSPCVQKDDMDKIYAAYDKADVIVFASPMYYWSISGQLKIVLDRLFAMMEINPDYQEDYKQDINSSSDKESIMLMVAGDKGKENNEPIEHYYASLVKNLRWTDKGLIIAEGVIGLRDIEGHPSLEEAKKLGESI